MLQKKRRQLPGLEGRHGKNPKDKTFKLLEAKILEAAQKKALHLADALKKGSPESTTDIARQRYGPSRKSLLRRKITLHEALLEEEVDECINNWQPWIPLYLYDDRSLSIRQPDEWIKLGTETYCQLEATALADEVYAILWNFCLSAKGKKIRGLVHQQNPCVSRYCIRNQNSVRKVVCVCVHLFGLPLPPYTNITENPCAGQMTLV
eukprot:GEMP01102539.1.p1 GENE.GEMP01102539.1~~GEMP01102539.1.p1  ORF type:complete len:207 (+),score=29.61 GEMP01102539.1:127-747(+)